MPLGHRMSTLPQARYCGKSPLLSAQYGSGLEALISQVYHAMCSRMEGWQDLRDRLPEDMRAEVEAWPLPTVVDVPDHEGVVQELDYGRAEVELYVALDSTGWSVAPGSSRAITEGHLDMAWRPEGTSCAFVADIKRTRWTVLDFERSLQLHAYGIAYATLRGADHYRIGIWTPTDEAWWWAREAVRIDSLECAKLQRTIVAAASNLDGQAVTGPHCCNCWGRAHCPEFLLPGALGGTALRALCERDDEPSNEELVQAVHEMSAMSRLLKVAEPQLKAIADRRDIRDPNGMIWCGRQRQGREYVNIKQARQSLGEAIEPHVQRAAPSTVYGWHAERRPS